MPRDQVAAYKVIKAKMFKHTIFVEVTDDQPHYLRTGRGIWKAVLSDNWAK